MEIERPGHFIMFDLKQKSTATKAQSVLCGPKDLPRFVEGQLITAHQLQEIPKAIGALEAACSLPKTTFEAFHLGRAITAGDLNQFIQPLTRLGHRLSLPINLKNFPVKAGNLIPAATLNELVDAVNALRHRLK